MYEDGFNIEEWKAKKLAERQETFAAQEEALKDVFASGQTLANYFYQRGRLGSHITAGNTALILRANPLACAVMSADDWSKYGRRVSKGCTGIAQIVMAAAESSYAGISENELMRQTAAAISVEVCGRLGLPMPPDVVQTLEGMKEHIPDGEERRALEKVRETAVTFGDAVCKCLKLERGQPAPQREER